LRDLRELAFDLRAQLLTTCCADAIDRLGGARLRHLAVRSTELILRLDEFVSACSRSNRLPAPAQPARDSARHATPKSSRALLSAIFDVASAIAARFDRLGVRAFL